MYPGLYPKAHSTIGAVASVQSSVKQGRARKHEYSRSDRMVRCVVHSDWQLCDILCWLNLLIKFSIKLTWQSRLISVARLVSIVPTQVAKNVPALGK